MNLAPEASVFPSPTLKEVWSGNRGYGYLTFIESRVIVYLYVNNLGNFLREWQTAVEKL